MERRAMGVVLAILAACVAGCCNKPLLDLRAIPPAISLEEQIARLDARTHALPRIFAKTVPLGVKLQYRDKKHEEHTQNVEGVLLLQPESAAGPQVLLVGRAFDRTVFEAGRNDKNWWFSMHFDPKTAFVGDSQRPIDWAALGNRNNKGEGMSTGVLRADLVPDLLGLRLLDTAEGLLSKDGPHDALVFRVDDYSVQNVILVQEIPPSAGRIWIKREIYIDRRDHGDIKEVRLYGPAGTMVMRSVLEKYKDVTYDDAATAPKTPGRFPFHIELEYPVQEMRITLDLDSVKIRTKEISIDTPDFQEEGMKVYHEE